jgi:hypothetical protein
MASGSLTSKTVIFAIVFVTINKRLVTRFSTIGLRVPSIVSLSCNSTGYTTSTSALATFLLTMIDPSNFRSLQDHPLGICHLWSNKKSDIDKFTELRALHTLCRLRSSP